MLSIRALVAAVLFVSFVILSACSGAPDESKVGLFARTNTGLQELTVYGEQVGSDSYRLPDLSALPAAKSVKAFFLNMPDATVANSKVFWLAAPQDRLDEDQVPALPVQVDAVKGNMYKLSSSEIESKRNGLLIFKVGMPLGTADRVYIVKLAE